MSLRRAGLRIESGLQQRHLRTQSAQHLLQHVVAPDADAVLHDLYVGVAVAEMPGQPHEFAWRGGPDLDQFLRLPADAHDGAIVQHQPVAVAQDHRLVEIEQDFRALLAGQHDAPPLAIVGVERNAVDGGGVGPLAGGGDGGNAVHGQTYTVVPAEPTGPREVRPEDRLRESRDP